MSTNTDCGCNNISENYNGCNCSTTEVTTICKPSVCPPSSCACPVYISSDCVNQVRSVFECSAIPTGLTLTETLEKLDKYICEKFGEVAKYLRIVNIGGGAEFYKGMNGLGEKVFRTLISTSDLVDIVQTTDRVQVSIDEPELINFIVENTPSVNYDAQSLGTGADVFKEETANVFKFRSLKSSDSSVSIIEGVDDIDIKATTYTAGAGLNLTGTVFSHADNSTAVDLTPTNRTYVKSLTFDSFGHVTGYTTGTETDQLIDGSETKITNGITTTVTGNGTIANPYKTETANLQKIVITSTTLTNADDQHTIFINNATTDVTITVPTGLLSNFSCGFVQQGTGVVSFVSSGTTINTPTGLKIKGQNYQAFLEKVLATEVYHLLGNVIV